MLNYRPELQIRINIMLFNNLQFEFISNLLNNSIMPNYLNIFTYYAIEYSY